MIEFYIEEISKSINVDTISKNMQDFIDIELNKEGSKVLKENLGYLIADIKEIIK